MPYGHGRWARVAALHHVWWKGYPRFFVSLGMCEFTCIHVRILKNLRNCNMTLVFVLFDAGTVSLILFELAEVSQIPI